MQSQWSNFSYEELACQHCGIMNLPEEFLISLQGLRESYGKAMTITSGYRCPAHPLETKKSSPGYHTKAAVDIAVSGEDANNLLTIALNSGWTGIGIQQKGSGRFLHFDQRSEPTMWSY
tara:strand:+ start:113 stop:469 length:357 start_codon:yes stop_codon:yes gene_type:complete